VPLTTTEVNLAKQLALMPDHALVETFFYIDSTGVVVETAKGGPNHVPLPVCRGVKVVMHNHPKPGSFSISDIEAAAVMGVKMISVHKNRTYIATDVNITDSDIPQLNQWRDEMLLKLGARSGIAPKWLGRKFRLKRMNKWVERNNDRVLQLNHCQMLKIAKAGFMKYESIIIP